MPRLLLNITDIQLHSRVNGPGLRSVVWVQGCTIGCPGCFNPHTHAHEPRHPFDPAVLGRQLAAVPNTDGITISGGEPFEQAGACQILASTVQAAGHSVMVFSGYTLEYLRQSSLPAVKEFLASIDLLVAGPYIALLRTDGRQWRASTNQTIHLLTDRLRQAAQSVSAAGPVVELTTDGCTVTSTGFPDVQDQQWFDRLFDTQNAPRDRPEANGSFITSNHARRPS